MDGLLKVSADVLTDVRKVVSDVTEGENVSPNSSSKQCSKVSY